MTMVVPVIEFWFASSHSLTFPTVGAHMFSMLWSSQRIRWGWTSLQLESPINITWGLVAWWVFLFLRRDCRSLIFCSCSSVFSLRSLLRLSSAMFLFVFSSATCSSVALSSVDFCAVLSSRFTSLLFSYSFVFSVWFSWLNLLLWSSSSWIFTFRLSISSWSCTSHSLASVSSFSIFLVVFTCFFLCSSISSFQTLVLLGNLFPLQVLWSFSCSPLRYCRLGWLGFVFLVGVGVSCFLLGGVSLLWFAIWDHLSCCLLGFCLCLTCWFLLLYVGKRRIRGSTGYSVFLPFRCHLFPQTGFPPDYLFGCQILRGLMLIPS